MPEIVCAFAWCDLGEGVFEGVRNRVEDPWLVLSDERLQLGEDLLDRIEVGRIFGEEKEAGAGGSDRVPHGLAFVRAEIATTISSGLRAGIRNFVT